MNVRKLVSCVGVVALVLLNASRPPYRSAPTERQFDGVVRVSTADGSTGSGFIVAAENGIAEIWTNAHIVGANKRCTVQFGTTSRKSEGTIVSRKLDRRKGIDVAKLRVPIPDGLVVAPLAVGNSHGNFDSAICSGWALGSRLHSYHVGPTSEFATVGRCFRPEPTNGESGGPILIEGKVVGVITWTYFQRKKAFGVMQPIEHFTGEPAPVAQTVPTVAKVWEVGMARNAD